MGVGEELGDEKEHLHMQGFLHCSKRTRSSLNRSLGKELHLEPSRGSFKQNQVYCSKGGNYKEYGVPLKPGKRKLSELMELAEAGATIQEMAHEFPTVWVHHGKGVKMWMVDVAGTEAVVPKFSFENYPEWEPITDWSISHILWGEAGIGKTQFALCHFPNALMVHHPDDLKKLTAKHGGIIFDDMDFQGVEGPERINYLEIDCARSVKCRFQDAVIPKGTKKIFTTNAMGGQIFPMMFDKQVTRRVAVQELKAFHF